nr:helix-turn-helix transcriptional regulator [Kibdelosporangium sp. MJ126-NF4]
MADTDDLSPGSLVRRWRLGKRLRGMREDAGKTMNEAAAYIGVKRPTISRIETGRQAILAKNVKFLCQFYGVGAPEVDTLMRQAEESNERGWWVSHSDTMPDWFEIYVGFEADAKEILTYSSEVVPGLLQTSDYMWALNRGAAMGKINMLAAEKLISFRQDRQERLIDRHTPYHVVLNEAVLRRRIGDMPGLIWHLIEMSERDHVTLQVLTFDSGAHPGMKGPFNLVTLPEEPAPNFVYVEHEDGAVYMERQSDLNRYIAVSEALKTQALSPKKTRDFLVTLAL